MSAQNDLKTKGYTIQKNLFSAADYQPLFERLVAYTQAVSGWHETNQENLRAQIMKLAEQSPEKRKLLFNACQLAPEIGAMAWSLKIQAFLKSLGFKNPILKNTNIRIDIPRHADFFLVDWHQDLLNLDADLSYTIWVPLQDITPKTGGVAVFEADSFQRIPQPSHKVEKGYERIEVEKLKGQQKFAQMGFGDALVFDPYLPHASQPGTKDVRLTLIMRFDCLDTFFDVTGQKREFERVLTDDPYLKSKSAQELYS